MDEGFVIIYLYGIIKYIQGVFMNIYILYGSQSGNAEGLASQAEAFFNQKEYNALVKDLAEVSVSELKSYDKILLITSTFGNGGAPTNAVTIHEALQTSTEDLSSTSFAVFALGSSKFPNFCQAGVDFDEYLSRLHSKKLMEIVKADGEFDVLFPQWLEDLNKILV